MDDGVLAAASAAIDGIRDRRALADAAHALVAFVAWMSDLAEHQDECAVCGNDVVEGEWVCKAGCPMPGAIAALTTIAGGTA